MNNINPEVGDRFIVNFRDGCDRCKSFCAHEAVIEEIDFNIKYKILLTGQCRIVSIASFKAGDSGVATYIYGDALANGQLRQSRYEIYKILNDIICASK